MSTFITANTSNDIILFQFLGIPINTIFCDTASISQFLIGDLRVLPHQSDNFLRSTFGFLRSCFRSNMAIFFISSRNRFVTTIYMHRDVDKERQTIFSGVIVSVSSLSMFAVCLILLSLSSSEETN